MDHVEPAETIDDYVVAFSPEVQAILRKIRSTIQRAAPAATEKISYRMPSFVLNSSLVYFAAFKQHIGFYPPVRSDPKLVKDASLYAGEKGNLRFPLDQPIPYALITRLVKTRVKENQERADKKKSASVKKPARKTKGA
jgi:uncharacterized protein YdhG (YjbR/CyaY superfamily)